MVMLVVVFYPNVDPGSLLHLDTMDQLAGFQIQEGIKILVELG